MSTVTVHKVSYPLNDTRPQAVEVTNNILSPATICLKKGNVIIELKNELPSGAVAIYPIAGIQANDKFNLMVTVSLSPVLSVSALDVTEVTFDPTSLMIARYIMAGTVAEPTLQFVGLIQ
ncbi:hypothetical protein BKA70DRAFT_1218636 [Coprinopsis sp. MPI-PUGE-AT-0042]|nr:hypothetical protein BKA70DRAFT_1218636 [Coprinopsis sp. MPI-PUGE-AT-0042]